MRHLAVDCVEIDGKIYVAAENAPAFAELKQLLFSERPKPAEPVEPLNEVKTTMSYLPLNSSLSRSTKTLPLKQPVERPIDNSDPKSMEAGHRRRHPRFEQLGENFTLADLNNLKTFINQTPFLDVPPIHSNLNYLYHLTQQYSPNLRIGGNVKYISLFGCYKDIPGSNLLIRIEPKVRASKYLAIRTDYVLTNLLFKDLPLGRDKFKLGEYSYFCTKRASYVYFYTQNLAEFRTLLDYLLSKCNLQKGLKLNSPFKF